MWGSQSGQGRQQVGGLANYEVTMATNVCFQAAPTKLVEEGRTHIGCSFEIRSFAFFDVRHLWTWVSSVYTLTHFRLHWGARPPITVWLRVRSGSTILKLCGKKLGVPVQLDNLLGQRTFPRMAQWHTGT